MDRNDLRPLIPLNSLTYGSFQQLTAQAVIEDLPEGTCLFSQGEPTGPHMLYLLEGKVALSSRDRPEPRIVVGGTEKAKYALGQLNPRQFTGIAKTEVTIAYIDSVLLNRLLAWDQAATYEVAEIGINQDAEWMMGLLRKDAFKKLPPANLASLFTRFNPVPVRAGQIIIRQGDAGEHYYLIKSGTADVLRRSEKTRKVTVVDHMAEGEGFGEEALLSGAPRNATVVMTTDGVLMRLKSQDFNDLLCDPLVKWVNLQDALAKSQAGACLLDVRTEEEFASGSIHGSVNVPLPRLRAQFACLERGREYIIFCQTGCRSCVGAFLLAQQGFDAAVLRGGLDSLEPF